ncbi:MAG: hypothetical protein K8T26_02130 [Lentisphaerae bacterium]|nr:hypothetical protein [Lentisphaerota bacterium]
MHCDADPIVLCSEQLKVEIARPGTIYAGTRFDWTGLVTQVTLDGKHRYCVPEDYGAWQGTGGSGLCNEFGIDRPIGYDDARPGEPFPKLGIGLLTRPDWPDYRFGTPHAIAQRFPVHVTAQEDAAVFTVDPLDCRGYAARLVKTLTIAGAQLEIAYQLENTGSRPIRTNEYGHNFVGFDGHAVGPAYVLSFPRPVVLDTEPARATILTVRDHQIGWGGIPAEPFYCRLGGVARSASPQWDLLHQPSGAAMSESVNFAPSRVAIWGTSHVVSVEVFVEIDLAPGQAMTWTRRYAFRS